MKTISIFVLALILWFCTSIVLVGGTSIESLMFIGLLVLAVGWRYAIPAVVYLACAEALSSRLRSGRVVVYLLLVIAGLAGLVALQHFVLGPELEDEDDVLLMVRNILAPTLVAAAVYLVRLLRRD